MKWRRLTTSSLLASSVLVYLLSLFRQCCLSSISSSSFSSLSFFSFSFSFSFSVTSSAWDWISSMNSERCLRIHHLIWHSRLYKHAFESRWLSSCWVFKCSFFRSCRNLLHLRINIDCRHLLHLRINMKSRIHQLHLLWSSIFRFRETIARSYYLWILNI